MYKVGRGSLSKTLVCFLRRVQRLFVYRPKNINLLSIVFQNHYFEYETSLFNNYMWAFNYSPKSS